MKRWIIALGAIAVAGFFALRPRPQPVISFAGPLQISNASTTPITVWGRDLPRDARVFFGGRELQITTRAKNRTSIHALAPPFAIAPELVRDRVKVEVKTKSAELIGAAEITVVNDAAFPTPIALAVQRGKWAVASPTNGTLYTSGGEVAVGPGARDVVAHDDGWVVAIDNGLRLVPTSTPASARTIPIFGRPQAIAIAGRTAWVTELARDRVLEVALDTGRINREIDVDPNPRALAVAGRTLWVSSMGSDTISWIDLDQIKPRPIEVEIGPGATIIGGPTARLANDVMGGKMARALVASDRAIFAATVGPNVGPNAERMSASTNGGVTVIDRGTKKFLRHVAIDGGLPQGLALDGDRLYVADVSRGRVIVLDAAKLFTSDEAARTAEIARIEIALPPGAPTIRDDAPASMHAGPWAVAIDRGTLYVLNRFIRTVDTYDGFRLESRVQLGGPETQPLRRMGETLYHTTLGRFRLTCDGCHPDGRDGGLLFTKPAPMRIYRSLSIRTVHDSAPFFTPPLFPTIKIVAHNLLGQFRPPEFAPKPAEALALTEYTLALSAPPSPFAGHDRVELADGWSGRPYEGQRIFEGRAGCARECHPPPHFTSDSAPATRGKLYDVGTGDPLPLQLDRQDRMPPGRAAPSLVGLWDNHPLFLGGNAGSKVEGQRLVPGDRFAIRAVLARGTKQHGALDELTDEQIDDLIAYLLTL